MKINIFWFRRDLRLHDNTGLYKALQAGLPVLPIFIFDAEILEKLPKNDARVNFIHEELSKIDQSVRSEGGGLLLAHGRPLEVWKELMSNYAIDTVYLNRDYEPYAQARDKSVYELLTGAGIKVKGYKDQVIFEKSEVVKPDGSPYTVYTPFKKKWLSQFHASLIENQPSESLNNFYQGQFSFPTLDEIGFQKSSTKVLPYTLKGVPTYGETRDFPAQDTTSYLSPHLRFGTISVRQVIREILGTSDVFLSELIWREFFMQILYHFPRVVTESFRPKYDRIEWINDESQFEKWCQGKTGYPMVDAGMRQLNETGYMHNRVRMVVASFLCKHLLIDWRWGEAYFAEKLLDFELASNNGNWQWAAGTGCDAAPYFRVFNPSEQLKKFDKEMKYIKQWVPELDTPKYPSPMVDHAFARKRALEVYQKGVKG